MTTRRQFLTGTSAMAAGLALHGAFSGPPASAAGGMMGGASFAPVAPAGPVPTPPHIKKGRVKPADRVKAAKKLQVAGAASIPVTVVQGGTPDYFGLTPNWANSPQAVLNIPSVVITDATGTGAVAVARVRGVKTLSVGLGGSGYSALYPPAVVFTGGGGSGAAATAIVTAGAVTGFTIDDPGNGYLTPPTVTIVGGGTGATATCTVDGVGPITGVVVLNGGTSYSAPSVAITDPFNSAATATTAVTVTGGEITLITVSASSGFGDFRGQTGGVGTIYGMRKFVDVLPQVGPADTNGDGLPGNGLGQYLPVAVAQQFAMAPDLLNNPNYDDYYEIALIEYSEQMHSDLPPTRLRGYVQIKNPGFVGTSADVPLFYPDGVTPITYPGTTTQVLAVDKPHYLGPVIVAGSYDPTKAKGAAGNGRPTRIKFYNFLPTGAGGDLFIPYDTSYMGAGMGPDGVVTSIKIVSGGSGYTTPPQVTIAAPGGTGNVRATAVATILNGSVNSISITNGGKGYAGPPALPPSVTFSSGAASATAVVAPAGMASTYTQNRATLHLHGGATPWISDGTPHQWITPAGENAVYPKGVGQRNVPDMPNPGDGAETFYYSNEQSARLMFYHDHAWGMTRLNVYAGEAAGYVVTDPVEQALATAGTLPDAVGIPLVIEDKSWVDETTVLTTDPTWNWGTGVAVGGIKPPVRGDLWLPHVWMPNQNPWAMDGTNACGRWDYGPWFWPPFTGILNQPVPNPLYPSVPGEPPYNPNIPNPSGVMEAFMDTMTVNGAAFPFLAVDPKPYRFRILNACNDRCLNLSLFTADPAQPAVDGRTLTEVKMVPAAPNSGLPADWPTDGRDGGIPDPTSRGPAWWQIGNEGGMLPAVAVIPPRPIGYEFNRKSITVLNTLGWALYMCPAERADVIVDFSAYQGQTLILYNDAPAANPAFDPRVDYYTGDPDQSLTGDATGGAPTTLPGFGPNTRTIMQFRVSGAAPVAGNLPALRAAIPGAFAASQPKPIMLDARYNAAYAPAVFPADPPFVRIQDNFANFFNGPLTSITVINQGINYTAPTVKVVGGGATVAASAQATVVGGKITAINLVAPNYGGAGYTSPPTIQITDTTGTLATAVPVGVSLHLGSKAIQELFTVDYGRMNATGGVELPFTNMMNQTTIPLGYVDPPTELLQDTPDLGVAIGTAGDGTQIWKFTHNGVDTHAVHFHLFNVQLVNRVGWDGMVKPPRDNELGWKDTVIMNPLEDCIVAIRAQLPKVPFDVPDSFRPFDVSAPIGATGQFFNVDPNNNPVTVTNQWNNFGNEYVWHCHMLEHEEIDFMRPMLVASVPAAPTGLSALGSLNPVKVTLNWVGSTAGASGFVIQRANDSLFTAGLTTFNVGLVTSYVDASAVKNSLYYYRVAATKVIGNASGAPGYPTLSAQSAWSNVAADANVIFGDNFERASLALTPPWTTLTGTSAAITTAAVMQGTYGLRVQNIGTPSFVTYTAPAARNTYHARFYFNPRNSVVPSGAQITIFEAVTGDAIPLPAVRVQYYQVSSTQYMVRAVAVTAAGNVQGTWFPISANAAHWIEIAYTVGAPGSLVLYVDSTTAKPALTGTFSRTIQSAKLGAVLTTATNTGNIFFDSFYSTVGTLIGPQVGTIVN